MLPTQQKENVQAVKHFTHLGAENPKKHTEWRKNVLPSFETPDLLPSAFNVLPNLPLYNAANYIGAQQIPNRSVVDNHTNNTGGLVSRGQDKPDTNDKLAVGLLPSQ